MTMTAGSLRTLMKYSWPGNVRELKNCIEGLVVMSTHSTLQQADLPERILEATSSLHNYPASQDGLANETPPAPNAALLEKNLLDIPSLPTLRTYDTTNRRVPRLNVEVGMSLDNINREVLRATLEYADNNKAKAAKILQISRRTIQRKAKEYGLCNDD